MQLESRPYYVMLRAKICAVLGYYAALSGSSVPTFRVNLSVSSLRVKNASTFRGNLSVAYSRGKKSATFRGNLSVPSRVKKSKLVDC